jgi:hypothetical protein
LITEFISDELGGLGGSTIRHRLASLVSLFEYLWDKNAVTHNPVRGVERHCGHCAPVVERLGWRLKARRYNVSCLKTDKSFHETSLTRNLSGSCLYRQRS